MRRTISTQTVREHVLSDRAVKIPYEAGAMDHDTMSRYGVTVKTGMWITYKERYTDNSFNYAHGRVLGRVEADAVNGQFPSPRIDGHISVLQLSQHMTHAYIRWVDPMDVTEVSLKPPQKLLAWITGELPSAEMVHKLADYGTLSERYIDRVDHHINAWEHGVSPSAWDAGVRSSKPCATCGDFHAEDSQCPVAIGEREGL